ncbi:hypothetical protein BDR06DRAFT_976618 [Suillus hirtellus]|nr:hypothetical protein BDR06DRAFT_976618 [Suillus hirtellus]
MAEASTSFKPLHAPSSSPLSKNDTFMPPSMVSALLLTASLVDLDLVTSLDIQPRMVSPPLKSAKPDTYADILVPPAASIKYNLFMAGMKKKSSKVMPQVGNSKKRKTTDDDADKALMTDTPKLPPWFSNLRQQRKKKF